MEYAKGGLRLSLTGFANRLKDAIANVTLGQGPGVFPGVGFVAAGGTFRQRQNVDAVKVRGIEASARMDPRAVVGARRREPHPCADAGPTARRRSSTGCGRRKRRSSPATLAGGWERDGKGAELVLRRVGAQFEDDLNSRKLKGATTLDAFASWPLTDRLQLVARGENITNALVMAAINGDGSIERATPRTLWLGLRMR